MLNFVYEWENVTFAIEEKKGRFWKPMKKKKVILDNGSVVSNSLVAIIGASGSGKSTLLRILSGTCEAKNSRLRINTKLIRRSFIQGVCGYMRQTDVFRETLTVFEHMTFMTALKLKKPNSQRLEIIRNLLYELGLESQEKTCIRVLSGGEKRRLSLATELIEERHILLCDEPTTGLDSFTAKRVIQKLEATASNGKVIVVTVHQPSSQLFNLFNNIILLANGKLIFQGTREEANNFFNRQNLICPPSYNPADFYLKVLTSDEIVDKLSELYRRKYQTNVHNEITYQNHIFQQRKCKRNFFFQIKWLMWRDFLDNKRDQSALPAFLLVLATSVLVAICFSQVIPGTTSSIQSIQGVLLLAISENIYEQMYKVIYIFPKEMNIFVRENAVYSPFPYFLSKLFSLVPFSIVYSLIYLAAYSLILPFLTGTIFLLKFFAILLISGLSGTALGLCVSAILPNAEYTTLFLVPFQQICMIFSGIWIKISSLSKIFEIVKNISPFYFAYGALCNAYWLDVQTIGNCTMETEMICFENGKQVLQYYGLSTNTKAFLWNMVNLLILICIFCYIGFIGIVRKRALAAS